MNRVQAESVEPILRQPIQGVVDEEVADDPAFRSIEIDGVAPGSLVPVGKKLRRVGVEIISFWAEMVVDHIQQNHHSMVMRTSNQAFEIFRAAVRAVGREREYAVVTPIALAGEVRNGH